MSFTINDKPASRQAVIEHAEKSVQAADNCYWNGKIVSKKEFVKKVKAYTFWKLPIWMETPKKN